MQDAQLTVEHDWDCAETHLVELLGFIISATMAVFDVYVCVHVACICVVKKPSFVRQKSSFNSILLVNNQGLIKEQLFSVLATNPYFNPVKHLLRVLRVGFEDSERVHALDCYGNALEDKVIIRV